MGKYFGTDGVRGRANDTLTLDMAVKIGQYVGWYYGKSRHAKILIGKDRSEERRVGKECGS